MNAFYLMLSTFVVAVLGFVFWAIVTRHYSSTTVGLAVTLLSLSGLLSMLSLAGFDTTFVRFLPKSERKNDQINSGIILVTLISSVLTLCTALLLPLVSPSLSFVTHSPYYLVGFVFFTAVTALNTLTNSVFLAYKCVRDVFIINLLFSMLKVVLPLFFTHGSAMTIFVLVGITQLVGLIISLGVMMIRLEYAFSLKVHWDILQTIKKYSTSVYVASILNLLPPTLLPLIVVRQLGAKSAAYYYMAFTIGGALYTIAYASMQSAFAEGSHNETALKDHLIKAAKLITTLLVPATLATIFLSNQLLKIFGHEYAAEGSVLLRLFAISALAVAVSSAMGVVFKIMHNLHAIIMMNIAYATVTLGLSYLLIVRIGVVVIGWAWLLGNMAAATVGLFFLKQSRKN